MCGAESSSYRRACEECDERHCIDIQGNGEEMESGLGMCLAVTYMAMHADRRCLENGRCIRARTVTSEYQGVMMVIAITSETTRTQRALVCWQTAERIHWEDRLDDQVEQFRFRPPPQSDYGQGTYGPGKRCPKSRAQEYRNLSEQDRAGLWMVRGQVK